jgi:hypothetical protein
MVTGAGLQPKVVISFWKGRTDSTDSVGASTIRPGVCLPCALSDQKNVTGYSQNRRRHISLRFVCRDDSCIDLMSGDNDYDGRASFTSMAPTVSR